MRYNDSEDSGWEDEMIEGGKGAGEPGGGAKLGWRYWQRRKVGPPSGHGGLEGLEIVKCCSDKQPAACLRNVTFAQGRVPSGGKAR